MSEINKNSLVITRLIQETQKGNIIWESIDDFDIVLPHEGEIVDKIYSGSFKNKKFRIYRYRYRTYTEEFDHLYWSSSIKLEILDDHDYPDWEFPSDNSLNDLYESVRYKVANIGGLIDDILGLEILSAKYGTKNKFIDITSSLNDKINNDRLLIKVSNAIAGDPDPNVPKTLRVTFLHQGKSYKVEVKENSFLDIP
jgi:hypothetical protein